MPSYIALFKYFQLLGMKIGHDCHKVIFTAKGGTMVMCSVMSVCQSVHRGCPCDHHLYLFKHVQFGKHSLPAIHSPMGPNLHCTGPCPQSCSQSSQTVDKRAVDIRLKCLLRPFEFNHVPMT